VGREGGQLHRRNYSLSVRGKNGVKFTRTIRLFELIQTSVDFASGRRGNGGYNTHRKRYIHDGKGGGLEAKDG